MNLNLSPEDLAEYTRRCLENEINKQAAIACGNVQGAKRARQANTYLYKEFAKRQLPPSPPTPWEREQSMSLEDRISRIEQHLKLGVWSE